MSNNTSFAGCLAGAMQADAEARELLGFEPDAVLSPAQELRVQIVTALRSVIAGQLDAKFADPNKLLQAAEALVKFLPAAAAPEPPQRVGVRERLAALIESQSARLAAERAADLAALKGEIVRLTDENVALRQAAAVQPIPVEILPPEPKALPAPEPQQDGADRANQTKPPSHWLKKSEPWDDFIGGANPRRPWWGPV